MSWNAAKRPQNTKFRTLVVKGQKTSGSGYNKCPTWTLAQVSLEKCLWSLPYCSIPMVTPFPVTPFVCLLFFFTCGRLNDYIRWLNHANLLMLMVESAVNGLILPGFPKDSLASLGPKVGLREPCADPWAAAATKFWDTRRCCIRGMIRYLGLILVS